MPAVKCPIEDCNYENSDLGDAVVAALITAHTVKNFGEITPISYLGFTNLV